MKCIRRSFSDSSFDSVEMNTLNRSYDNFTSDTNVCFGPKNQCSYCRLFFSKKPTDKSDSFPDLKRNLIRPNRFYFVDLNGKILKDDELTAKDSEDISLQERCTRHLSKMKKRIKKFNKQKVSSKNCTILKNQNLCRKKYFFFFSF